MTHQSHYLPTARMARPQASLVRLSLVSCGAFALAATFCGPAGAFEHAWLSLTGDFLNVTDKVQLSFEHAMGLDPTDALYGRTYSSTGGTNKVGDDIAPGGFDPRLWLYDVSGGGEALRGENDDGGPGYDAYLTWPGLADGGGAITTATLPPGDYRWDLTAYESRYPGGASPWALDIVSQSFSDYLRGLTTIGGATIRTLKYGGSDPAYSNQWVALSHSATRISDELVVGTQGNARLTVDTTAVLETPGYNVIARSGTAEGTAVIEQGGVWHAGAGLTLGLRDTAKGYLLVYEESSVDVGDMYAGAQVSGYGQIGVYDGGVLTVDQKLSLGDNDTAKGDLFVRRGGQVSASRIFLGGSGSGEGYITLTEPSSKIETLSLAVGGTINNEGTSSSPGGIGGIGIQDGTIVVKNTLKLWDGSVYVNGVLKAGTIDKGWGTAFTTVGGSSLYANRLTGFGDAPRFYGNLVLGHMESNGVAMHTVGPGQSLDVDANLVLGSDAPVNFWAYGAGAVSSLQAYVAGLPGSGNTSVRISDPPRAWNITRQLQIGGDGAHVGGAGTLTIANSALVAAEYVRVWPTSTLELDQGTISAANIDLSGGLLQGNGGVQFPTAVAGELRNAGVVSPGLPIASGGVGQIYTAGGGDYVQTGLGKLAIDLGGPLAGQYDRLSMNDGAASLAGALEVSLVDLGSGVFAPRAGDAFAIVTAADGVTGAFNPAQTTLPGLSAGLNWQLDYAANQTWLRVVPAVFLAADFDEDYDVDAADLARWKSGCGLASGALHTQGDATADGRVDGADFLVWQRQLGAASPSLGADAQIPEPAATLLAGVGGIVLAWTRTRATWRAVPCNAAP